MQALIRCPTCGETAGPDDLEDPPVFVAQCLTCYHEAVDETPDCPQCEDPMTEILTVAGEREGWACERAACPQGLWNPDEVLRKHGLHGLVQD